MGRKETRYLQCAHFNEEKCDRNENMEEGEQLARSPGCVHRMHFKTKAAKECFENLLCMFS